MNKMKALIKDSNSMVAWFESKKQEINALPDEP